MQKLKPEDIEKIAEENRYIINLRESGGKETSKSKYRMHLMLCAGTGCVSNKALEVKTALQDELQKHGLVDEILVVPTGCNGFCAQGPILVVQPGNIFYQMVTKEKVPRLVEEHLKKGKLVEELMKK